MPYIGIGLHVLAAIYFAVHAIRSGQSLYWLILLFSFPLLGSVVYFLAIYFPEARNSRGARQAMRSAKRLMDPGQELRNARAELARTPTVQNRLRLGMTLLDAGQTEEARTLLEQAASSPLGDDPYILTGLARARLDSGHAALAAETLDGLFTRYRTLAANQNKPCCMRRHWPRPRHRKPAPHSNARWNAEMTRPLAACSPNG